MKDMNVSYFTGRLVRDPELKQLQENSVTNFTLAVDDSYKDKEGNWVNRANFVDFVLWNGHGKVLAEKCRKGNFVQITSKFTPQSWEDKETGQKRTRGVFTVTDWRKYDLVKATRNVSETNEITGTNYNNTEDDDNDIPF